MSIVSYKLLGASTVAQIVREPSAETLSLAESSRNSDYTLYFCAGITLLVVLFVGFMLVKRRKRRYRSRW